MTVYFIADNFGGPVKIGISKNIDLRLSTLQTGNPRELKLMAFIMTDTKKEDHKIESALHKYFSTKNIRGEWFELYPEDVLDILKTHFYTTGFLALSQDSLNIIDVDRDGTPIVGDVWDWGAEWEDCCPYCGCVCGLHYEDKIMLHECIKCGYQNLSEIFRPDLDEDEFLEDTPNESHLESDDS